MHAKETVTLCNDRHLGLAGPGQWLDSSPCSLQPSEDPEVGLDSPMNHMLLGSAGSGLGVLRFSRAELPGYPHSTAGFTAQGKMVGLTNERLLPPPLSTSRSRGGGRARPAHRAWPLSSPSLGWSYTRGSQLGSCLGQGRRTTVTRTPSPGGPQVPSAIRSQAPELPGPCLGKLRSYVSSLGKSLCEKRPEGPWARSVAGLGNEWVPLSHAAESQEQPGLRAPTQPLHPSSADKRKETLHQRDLEKGLVFIAL